MRYLLDTCVLSELVKPGPAPGVMTWMAGRKADELFVSAMTLGELQRGVAKLPLSRRRNELQLWLQQVEDGFGERILPFGRDAAHAWAQMCARAEAVGKPMAAFDSIIAATAVEHGLALVTRNVQDFAAAPLMLINPWEQPT